RGRTPGRSGVSSRPDPRTARAGHGRVSPFGAGLRQAAPGTVHRGTVRRRARAAVCLLIAIERVKVLSALAGQLSCCLEDRLDGRDLTEGFRDERVAEHSV